MATPQAPSGHEASSQSSGQHQHYNYSSYWYFMQQPQNQQQAPAGQPTYGYGYTTSNGQQQQAPTNQSAAVGGAAAVNDPWSQLANTFSYLQPPNQQMYQQQHQPHHHHQQHHHQDYHRHQDRQGHYQQQQQPHMEGFASAHYGDHQQQGAYSHESHSALEPAAVSSRQENSYQQQPPSSHVQGQMHYGATSDPYGHAIGSDAQHQHTRSDRHQERGIGSDIQHHHTRSDQHHHYHHAGTASDSHVQATPDLVVATGADVGFEPQPSVPLTPQGASSAAVESTLPDLWYGHASQGYNGQGPDIVSSKSSSMDRQAPPADAAVREENLEDVALSGSPANEEPVNVMMNLDDYLQAPESDRPQSLVAASGAIFSISASAEISSSHNQDQSYHRQQSEADSWYAQQQQQQQPRLSLSEMFTHSYYEADVKPAAAPPTAPVSTSESDSAAVTMREAEDHKEDTDAVEMERAEADDPGAAAEVAPEVPVPARRTPEPSNVENEMAQELEGVEADGAIEPANEKTEANQDEGASAWDDWGEEEDNSGGADENIGGEEAEGVEADAVETPMEIKPNVDHPTNSSRNSEEPKKAEEPEDDGKAAVAVYVTEIDVHEKINAPEQSVVLATSDTTPDQKDEEEERPNIQPEPEAPAADIQPQVDWDTADQQKGNQTSADFDRSNVMSVSSSTSPKKKRQESLHKRFQEASAKSRLALERLQREKGMLNTSPAPPVQPTVSLWSTTDHVPKTRQVLLMPVSASNSQRTSTSANETPVVSPAVGQQKPKIPSTSTPKDNSIDSDKPTSGTDEKKGSSTAPKHVEVSKAPKKTAPLSKSQSTDAGAGGILKKEPGGAKGGRHLPPPRRESVPDEEDEDEKENMSDRDRRRPSSRGSVHSAYEGYSHYDDRDRRYLAPDEYGGRREHDWYRSYYFKRRPYSRASDREDWRYYQGYERYRPRSTQSYAGGEREYGDEDDEERENEGEDEKSDNGSDDYDDEDERREMEAYYRRRVGYPRHPNQRYHDYRYQHAYQHYQQQQYHIGSFDPAWQRYIMEYYRYYGQYPTYDQLHRMWTEQQKRAQQQQKTRQGQHQAEGQQPQSDEQRKTSGATAAADVLAQQKGLLTLQYGDGDDSQPSLSRAKTDPDLTQLAQVHGSEKSFEIRSDLSSNVSGAIFGGPTVAGVRPEKIREPLKHSVCHAICRFGAGGHLILVTSPSARVSAGQQTPSKTVEIRNLRTYLTDPRCQTEMEKIDKFPGPLSSKDTSKLAVVQFCQKKLDEIAKYVPSASMDDQSMALTDRDSVALMWRFLLLLVRQNGVAMGNDLAQLLLETRSESAALSDEFTGLNWEREVEREVFHHPHEDSERRHGGGHDGDDGTFEGSTDDQVDNDVYGDERDRHHRSGRRRLHEHAGKGSRVAHDRTLINCSTQTSDLVEFQFRQLLLSGNKKEALEWAIRYRLWGHALFLAMKVDQRTHTNVMTRFANSLALNDPLQTLYQMLSGGTPYAVTRVPDDKWGDWRPHLAMILSNLTPATTVADPANAEVQLQLQRQQEQQQQEFWSILTMGKTLMGAGRPYAAHFCFLCCHVLAGWDVFSPAPGDEQQKRLVSLIGAFDEEKPDEIFTLERYQCTEVYEYAIGLRNQPLQAASSLPTIQTYKWTYTLRLAEYGYREEAFRYLYQLTSTIQACPQYFSASFAKAVYELAGRLQQFDPTVETIGSSLRSWQQPAWLNELASVAAALEATTQQQAQQQQTNVAPAFQEQQAPPQQQPQPQPTHQQQLQQQYYQGLLQPTPEHAINHNAPVVEYQSAPMEAPFQQDRRPSLVHHPAAPYAGSRQSSVAARDWDRQSSVGHSEAFDLGGSQASNFLIGAYDKQEYDQQYSYNASPVRDHRSPSVASQQESIASMSNESHGRARTGSRSYAEVATTPPPRAPGGGMSSGQASPTAVQKPIDYWESTAGGSYGGVNTGQSFVQGRRFSSADHDVTDGVHGDTIMMGAVVTGVSPHVGDFGTPGSDNVFGASPMQPPQQQQAILHQQQPQWNTNLAAPQLMQQQPKQTPLVNKPASTGGEVKSAPPGLGKTGLDEKAKRNPSWFGRAVGNVIYKMMPKGPNEMILPDDKKKSIVWDADKQRWVNVNGDDDDSNQVTAPPPSDFQLHAAPDAPSADPVPAMTAPAANTTFLEQAYQQARQPMAQQQQQQQQQQVAPAQQAMTTQQQGQQQAAISKPSGGLNRYRRNENRRYVDVFGVGGGGGGGGMDPSFAPPLPMAGGMMGNVNVFTPEPEEN